MTDELEIVVLGNLPQLKRPSMFNLINIADLEALLRYNLKIPKFNLFIYR